MTLTASTTLLPPFFDFLDLELAGEGLSLLPSSIDPTLPIVGLSPFFSVVPGIERGPTTPVRIDRIAPNPDSPATVVPPSAVMKRKEQREERPNEISPGVLEWRIVLRSVWDVGSRRKVRPRWG